MSNPSHACMPQTDLAEPTVYTSHVLGNPRTYPRDVTKIFQTSQYTTYSSYLLMDSVQEYIVGCNENEPRANLRPSADCRCLTHTRRM